MAEYASLKTAAGVSFYASNRALAAVAFRPEDIHLGDYAFAPFVRIGLAAAISAQPVGNRAVVTARVEVADSANPAASQPVSRDLTLYGPGDVTGIDPGQIIRREPGPNSADAEQGYLAHVEFARPDFPWMFTPRPTTGDRCEPWLALIVCEAAVSHVAPSQGELPAQIWTKKGQLQSLTDHDRFCHAQVVGAAIDAAGPRLHGPQADTVETRLSDEHGPANLSRILCPRRLDDGVTYIAALVPTYDCGVRAGLGNPGGSLDPAWSRAAGDQDDDIVLPVYDHWTFRTAPGGSFRELAEKIKGRAAPWTIGRRMIDLSQPGGTIPALAPGDAAGIQILKCALYSPADTPAGRILPPAWPSAHREAVRLRVDQANDVTDPDLPRVGARLYARYQRAANRLGPVLGTAPFASAAAADADWFSQLNTDPMLRIVAALGAKVVRKDQEALMQAAWAQVDGIRRANQALVWAGMAEVVNISIQDRHLAPLDPGTLMQVTRNLHGRVRDLAQPRSIMAAVTDSRTAATAVTGAFRRALRAGGSIGQKLALAAPGNMVAGAAGFADHRRGYRTPDGIRGISKAGMAFLSPELVGRVLGVPPDRAMTSLTEKVTALSQKGGALTQLVHAEWKGVNTGRAGDIVAGGLLDRLGDRIRQVEAGTLTGAEPLAELLVGIGNSGGAIADRAKTDLGRIGRTVRPVDLPGRLAVPGGTRPIQPGAIQPGLVQRDVIGRDTMINPNIAGGRVTMGTPLSGRIPAPVLLDRPVDRPVIELSREPEVRFETDMSRWVAGNLAELNAIPIQTLRAQLSDMVRAQPAPPAVQTDLGPLTLSKAAVLAQIDPRKTARAAFKGRVDLVSAAIPGHWLDLFGLRPIMAAPEFRRPMSAALEDMDRDWLVPGLGEIADRDFVTLLAINPGFAEAFLIGASDEMGRELLWRDYPTDQRGTYFKRFWDADQDELTDPIHRFSRQPVGNHFRIGGDAKAGAGALALVVRGELLRRFPDTVIMAVQAISDAVPPTFAQDTEARVLFHTHMDPDYTVVGFDLTEERVKTGNWWFILAQNPTAPRFGLAANPSAATTHDMLDWADFGTIPEGGFLTLGQTFPVLDENGKPKTVQWPGHAGVVARVLLTNPIRAAFRADKLIASTRTQP